MGRMMQDPDHLANVFRAEQASEDSVAWLWWLQGVSKQWQAAATRLLKDKTWRAPFQRLAAEFLVEIDALSHMVDPDRAGEFTDDAAQRCRVFPRRMRAYACEESEQASALALATHIVHRRLQPCPPGMIRAVCGVMRAHPANLSVQHQALEVITALRRFHFTGLQEEDAISPIVDVLNRHGADLPVVRVLVLLADTANLSADELPGIHGSMATAGVLQALVRAMGLSPTTRKFQVRAVQCFQRLVLHVPQQMIAAGVAEAVFDCMRLYPATFDVQHGSAFVLFELERSGPPGGVDFFAPSKGMELVFAVNQLTTNTKSLDLVGNVAHKSADAMERMLALGLVPLLRTVMAQRYAFESVLAAGRVMMLLSSDAQTRHVVFPRPARSPLSSTL